MKKQLIISALIGLALSTTSVSAMDAALVAKVEVAMNAGHRSEKNIARNKYRHPLGTLAFFGLKPNMTVLEIAPGGGWYTEILAPTMRDTGVYISGSYDVSLDNLPDYQYRVVDKLLDNIKEVPEVYGQVEVSAYSPPESRDLGSANSVDMVLTFRSNHGWIRSEVIDTVYEDFFKVLKPGGVLGVVQHRAPEGGDPEDWAENGYVAESYVISVAEKAGFVLDGKSEVNANPLDSKDHERGVWTLPPTLSLGEVDREKYLAIGESDRMTLRFVKPAK